MNTPMLNHEKLDCYQIAVELLGHFARLAEQYPRGYGPLADQLRRASLSIPLNIAEGYGKRSIADRSRFMLSLGVQPTSVEPSWMPVQSLASLPMPTSARQKSFSYASSQCS